MENMDLSLNEEQIFRAKHVDDVKIAIAERVLCPVIDKIIATHNSLVCSLMRWCGKIDNMQLL